MRQTAGEATEIRFSDFLWDQVKALGIKKDLHPIPCLQAEFLSDLLGDRNMTL